jgi:hypothetical protein
MDPTLFEPNWRIYAIYAPVTSPAAPLDGPWLLPRLCPFVLSYVASRTETSSGRHVKPDPDSFQGKLVWGPAIFPQSEFIQPHSVAHPVDEQPPLQMNPTPPNLSAQRNTFTSSVVASLVWSEPKV